MSGSYRTTDHLDRCPHCGGLEFHRLSCPEGDLRCHPFASIPEDLWTDSARERILARFGPYAPGRDQ